MRRVYLSLPEELLARVEAWSERRGASSRSAAIRDLLTSELEPDNAPISPGQVGAFYAKVSTLAKLNGDERRGVIAYHLHEASIETKRRIEKPEQLSRLEANTVLNRLDDRVHEFEVAAKAPATPSEKTGVPA